MKIIEITIDSKGQARVETKGFTGTECRDASRFLESALGKTACETLKPEFHREQSADQALKQST
jgi:hypothetical protein